MPRRTFVVPPGAANSREPNRETPALTRGRRRPMARRIRGGRAPPTGRRWATHLAVFDFSSGIGYGHTSGGIRRSPTARRLDAIDCRPASISLPNAGAPSRDSSASLPSRLYAVRVGARRLLVDAGTIRMAVDVANGGGSNPWMFNSHGSFRTRRMRQLVPFRVPVAALILAAQQRFLRATRSWVQGACDQRPCARFGQLRALCDSRSRHWCGTWRLYGHDALLRSAPGTRLNGRQQGRRDIVQRSLHMVH